MEAKKEKVRTKYEVFKFAVTTGVAADIEIDRNIDPRYKRITDIFIYTDNDIDDNENLEVTRDIKISGEVLFSKDFDTALLFPIKQKQEFTKLREPIKLDNSKIEGRLQSVGTMAATGYLKIILKVEE